MANHPEKQIPIVRSAAHSASATSAVGKGESYGSQRARRLSLFTKSALGITTFVCTALLLGALTQAWSNTILIAKVNKEQQLLNQSQQQHNNLQQSAAYYNHPEVIDSEARQQFGYVKPGEQEVVVIPTHNKPTQTSGKPAQNLAPQHTSFWQDWWHLFFG